MLMLLRDWLVDPLALLFLLSLSLVGARLWRRGSRRGWVAAGIWVVCFLMVSAPRLVNPLVSLLEKQHASLPVCAPDLPIVVLGGGVDSRVESSAEFERMQPATLARVAAAARLAQVHSGVPIVVAGGALRQVSEAAVMASLLERLGVAGSRLLQEANSANTWSNAKNVAELLRSKQLPAGVRLVTSALHMRRATSAFERNGLSVCPVAVDYQALQDIPAWAFMPQTTALVKFDKLMHELVALVVYRFRY